MTNYKMNFATKTLTITKAFAAMAMKSNTDEANTLAHLKSLFPDLKIAYKTCCSTGSHPFKGMTYNKMERYIRLHENAGDLLIAFSTVKEIGRTQPNAHNYVCKWFLEQFPDYREMPTLKNGKIAAAESIVYPTAKEAENTMIAA